MRVTVKVARFEHLGEEGVGSPPSELLLVEANLLHLLDVRQLERRDELERQHLRRRESPVHVRHLDIVDTHILKCLCEAHAILRLELVVDLFVQELARLLVNVRVRAVSAVRLRVELVKQLDKYLEVLQVGVEELLQPGTLHLDRHWLPLVHGLVNLPQGSCRDGLSVKLVKELTDRLAELRSDDRHRLVATETGHVVLQIFEHVDIFFLEHVRAGGNHLAQFDKRGAEAEEAIANELGGRRLRCAPLLVGALRLACLEHLQGGAGQKSPHLRRAAQRGSLAPCLPSCLHVALAVYLVVAC
mmetsp:Transcript_4172/g.9458  ORF Transcript_4172/g.9458 Transcript_4172/m.9458 type:complete len:301 (+) Transcript_4172:1475-2377(+)